MPFHETAPAQALSADSRPVLPTAGSPGDGRSAPSGQADAEPIWELVRRVRKLRGLTQYQLADRLVDLSGNSSVSRDEVARWERGKRVPGPYWRQWLSLALDVPSDQLTAAVRYGRTMR
nr:helix-turn-helix transcriptional regulator [Saccharomonospora saliphila]